MQGEQGYSNRGFQATDELANSLANVLASQGGLAYQGKATQGARFGDLLKAYMGMMGSATGAARGASDGLSTFSF